MSEGNLEDIIMENEQKNPTQNRYEDYELQLAGDPQYRTSIVPSIPNTNREQTTSDRSDCPKITIVDPDSLRFEEMPDPKAGEFCINKSSTFVIANDRSSMAEALKMNSEKAIKSK